MSDEKIESKNDARYQREMLEYRVDAWLRSKGWKSTCDTPGSLWLWQRTLDDGRVALVNKSTAESMQAWFDFLAEPPEASEESP
jgi:hypothetical protein